jgi:hypothetical protein
MVSFEAGFIKYATESGLSDQQAVQMLKRAMDYPGAQDMFKELPEEHEQQTNPGNMAVLADMVKQQLLHEQIGDYQKQIQLT